jgi:hypothetical protein
MFSRLDEPSSHMESATTQARSSTLKVRLF